MEVLERFTHELDVYSIDEAFLTVDHSHRRRRRRHDARLGHDVKDTLRRLIGVPVLRRDRPHTDSGEARERTAKRSTCSAGYASGQQLDQVARRLMEALPVSEVWGIPRTAGAPAERLCCKNREA